MTQKRAAVAKPLHAVAEVSAPKGYPDVDSVARAYDAADLDRAIQAYRFFYPTVSAAAMLRGPISIGAVPNRSFGILAARPLQQVFTANADTPYAVAPLDLRIGPISVEMPAGPLIGVANDLNQRWVIDMGLPGPDAGKGGKHLILPPDYDDAIPEGYYVGRSTTNLLLLAIRALPLGGDVKGAFDRIRTIKVAPLVLPSGWTDPEWSDVSNVRQDASPVTYERGIGFWERLHEVINSEPGFEPYRNAYGELAALGIAKGKPFAPDRRMKALLEKAANLGWEQMRAQAFADRRPDRVAWRDRAWEWLALTPESGTFDTPHYVDVQAREKWFFQAILESPAMFRRQVGGGSVYWGAFRDSQGGYLDGGHTYRLVVPQPVPAGLFWSVTVYDAETRSMIAAPQDRPALRSLFELEDKASQPSVELIFGPDAPKGREGEWVQTLPGRGWFAYFRVYGPEAGAFDGSWRPGDFELTP